MSFRGLERCVPRFLLLQRTIHVDRRRHPHRPAQTSASTDADIRIDRRRHPHRPAQTSASTGADVRIDRRGCLKCCNCVIIIFDFELIEWWSGFLKVGIKKRVKPLLKFDSLLGGRWDSNPRHSEPQSDALTN